MTAPTACPPTTVAPCEHVATIEPSTCDEALRPKDDTPVVPAWRKHGPYSEFSKSIKRLGMLTAGEAGTTSNISIGSWTAPKPTAGEGLVFGAARNKLVKACWPMFGEQPPPAPSPHRRPALPLFCAFSWLHCLPCRPGGKSRTEIGPIGKGTDRDHRDPIGTDRDPCSFRTPRPDRPPTWCT